MEALNEMNKLVDDSDPDVDVPNIMHAFQTAERIREKQPDKGYFLTLNVRAVFLCFFYYWFLFYLICSPKKRHILFIINFSK